MKNMSAIQNNYLAKGLQKPQKANNIIKRLKTFFSDLNPFAVKQRYMILTKELHKKQEEIDRLKWELLQKKEQVRDISFHQSHMVRRPLANILGIIELMNTNKNELGEAEMQELISLLKISADALDKAIKHNSATGIL
jgi:signal transduction histidine kinase